MRRNAAQPLCKQLGHLGRVVDIPDHRIFKGNSSSCFFKIMPARRQQRLDGIAPVDRHDGAADLVARCVQGDRQRELQVLLREPLDPVDQTAGGQADVTHADIHALFRVHKRQKAQYGVIIIQRLSDAHEHDVRHRQTGIELREQHLVEHFRRREPAHKAALCGPWPKRAFVRPPAV